jgi:hypothetical protein
MLTTDPKKCLHFLLKREANFRSVYAADSFGAVCATCGTLFTVSPLVIQPILHDKPTEGESTK